MKCPRCVQRIHRAAASCPHCGFSLADADERFGADVVRLRSLTDGAGLLRRGERGKVEAAMEDIGRRFPQIFVAVYTGSLGEVANIRQFGFWLLNRAAFEDVPVSKPNEAGILLTIDPESRAAGMAFGYLLDPNDAKEREVAEDLNHKLVARALNLEGTCTGEHGVGLHKMDFLVTEAGAGAVDMMRAIKRALDPKNIMNPGKIFVL